MRRVERRQPHQAMHALLGTQIPKRVLPVDRDGHGLDTRLLALGTIQHLRFEAAFFGPAQVHALEHGGPVLRVGAARARVDRQNGVIVIVTSGEHRRKGARLHFLLDGGDFDFQFRAQAGVIQVRQFQRVADLTPEGAPAIHLVAQFGGGFADALRRPRIIPEIGRGNLLV